MILKVKNPLMHAKEPQLPLTNMIAEKPTISNWESKQFYII